MVVMVTNMHRLCEGQQLPRLISGRELYLLSEGELCRKG